MADKTKQDLRKIEKAMVKLRNGLKRADLNYTVQISLNSTDPTVVSYASQMTAPAEGLAPVTFISTVSVDDLIEQIKAQQKLIDHAAVEKAYHQAQIDACKRTIMVHEERLKNMDEEAKLDNEAAPEDGAADVTQPES